MALTILLKVIPKKSSQVNVRLQFVDHFERFCRQIQIFIINRFKYIINKLKDIFLKIFLSLYR